MVRCGSLLNAVGIGLLALFAAACARAQVPKSPSSPRAPQTRPAVSARGAKPAAQLAEFASAHYRLQTDLPASFAGEILAHMERARRAYLALVPFPAPAPDGAGGAPRLPVPAAPPDNAPADPRQPQSQKTRARRFRLIVFARLADFQAYHKQRWRERTPRLNFVYHHAAKPSAREVCGYWKPRAAFFASLAHEGFHQYARARIAEPPQWLNEGTAEFFEATELGGAAPKPAVHQGWARQLRERVRPAPAGPRKYARIPLATLVRQTKVAWLGAQGAAYPESWALVYWLARVHAGGPALLAAYWRALAPRASRAENTRRAFTTVFEPRDLPALERAFFAWLAALSPSAGYTDLTRARQALGRGDLDAAKRALDRAVRADPGFYASRYYRGLVRWRLKDAAGALDEAEAALALFPEYGAAMELAVETSRALKRPAVTEYWVGRMRQFAKKTVRRHSAALAQVDAWRRAHPGAPTYDANPPPKPARAPNPGS